MNFCKGAVLLGLLCSFFMGSNAHPFTTFGMQIMNVTQDGVMNPTELVTGKQTRIYFHFVDNLHNYAKVELQSVEHYHQRYFHILMVSQDQELALHAHPDDFMDLTNAPLDTSLFYIDVTFSRGGTYSLAASFLFNDAILKKTREGFAQTELPISGTPNTASYDYSTTGRYATYSLDNKGNFDSWVDVKTNEDDTNGYWAEFEIFGSDNSLVNSTTNLNSSMNYVHANVCTWFKLTVYKNDSTMSTPATMIPYLAAAVHLTVALDDGGVYHAHGMYLPDDMTFDQLLASQKGMTMPKMMKLKTTDPMYNISMNAAMIGIENTGTMNCLSDEGDVMDYMMDMMDMDFFYGPSTFGSVVGIFDFPAPGVSNWKIFAYMKMLMPDGEERLIVPHFSVKSVGADLPIIPPSTTDELSNSEATATSAGVMIAPVQFFIFALACLIALL